MINQSQLVNDFFKLTRMTNNNQMLSTKVSQKIAGVLD